MAGKKQNPMTVVGLIVVIVIALMFVIKVAKPKRYSSGGVDWICDACGYQFVGPSGASPSECAKCGEMEVVRTSYYECEKCGTVFEAFRTKMASLTAAEEGTEGRPRPTAMGFIKKPDGPWVTETPEETRKIWDELVCPEPECGNDDLETLKYSPASME